MTKRSFYVEAFCFLQNTPTRLSGGLTVQSFTRQGDFYFLNIF